VLNTNSRLIAFSLSFALLAGAACSSGGSNNGTGSAGTSGTGTAGTTGAGGTNSTGGTTGLAGNGASGTTGTAGTTTGSAGTTGAGGSTTGTAGTTGSAGTTGAGGTSPTGTAGTTGGAGRGGTTGTAGSAGTGGAGGSAAGTGGTAGTLGPGGAPPACMTAGAVGGVPGSVAVDLSMTVRASVSPDLMGVHTSVYDNNMLLPTTPDLLKAAGVKSLRYPGGSYADLYHWSTHTATYTPASGAGSNTIYVATDTYFGNFLLFMEKVGASALITVNYGMNSTHDGPGEPKEAAAMVAYANGTTSSTVNIGADSKGNDWKTVAYWAGLRAAGPMPTDDGFNKFRINHPAPFNIKYWEIGNELYGNGYYYGGCGWEADMHVAYPTSGTTCSGRMNNSALSPSTYGTAIGAFATAMKAVDSSIKIGGIVVGTSETEYANPSWNAMALAAGCSKMDFASLHWYAPANSMSITINNIATVPELELPGTMARVRTALGTAAYNCPGGANMPIAITEWGPNTLNGSGITIPMSTVDHTPAGSQSLGLFAAEAYANMAEQGVLAAHWLELHNNSYLAGVDATNDPFTMLNDTPRWGYHGQQIAHFLADGGEKMVKATTSTTGFGTALKSHASVHANGDVSVMITNTNRNNDAAVTVSLTGGNLGCVGTRYAYTPILPDYDGGLTGDWIYANSAGTGFTVLVPKFSSVVVTFPKK